MKLRAIVIVAMMSLAVGGAEARHKHKHHGRACGAARCAEGEICEPKVEGTCPDERHPGTCVKSPQLMCAQDCPGVCGCDGKQYCNACIAGQHGTTAAHDGSCAKSGGKPEGCKAALDCKGILPQLCKVCGDGKQQCAHFACVAGACRVELCPEPNPCASDADCNPGRKCCYPCGIQGCKNQCTDNLQDGRCPAYP